MNAIKDFDEYFKKNVARVDVYPQGTVTKYLDNITPGVCRLNKEDNLVIEMLGYNGAREDKYSWIKHEGTHEFCHSFVDLLPQTMSKNPDGIVKNGILYKNHMGMIRETDSETGKFVGQHYYGKMYNEAMMDIITSMAINYFDPNPGDANVDKILKTNYKEWGNELSGYLIFTSLTRLTIAVFSNNADINYQNIVDEGSSIFDAETEMTNGEKYKLNDFLYGIVFDPLHIEEEFDERRIWCLFFKKRS